MKRIFTNLFVAVLLMLSSASWAQFENGKVVVICFLGMPNTCLEDNAEGPRYFYIHNLTKCRSKLSYNICCLAMPLNNKQNFKIRI